MADIVSRPFGSAPAACERCVFNRGDHSLWCPVSHWGTPSFKHDDEDDEDWLSVGRKAWAAVEWRS